MKCYDVFIYVTYLKKKYQPNGHNCKISRYLIIEYTRTYKPN